MKILLTGATGFVGSHVARVLVSQEHEVFALVRPKSKYEFLKKLGVNLVFGELDKPEVAEIQLPQINGVIHLAGLIKALRRDDFYRTNVEGTRNLLNLLKNQSLNSFVFVSSIAARGPNRFLDDHEGVGPVSHYGRSKREAEELVIQNHGQYPVIIFRPPVIYGPGDRETLSLFKMFKGGWLPIIGKGERRISFVYVEDLVKALIATLLDPPKTVKTFYPEDGHGGYSWSEFHAIAEEIYRKKIRKIFVPLWSVRLLAVLNEILGRFRGVVPMLSGEKYSEIKQPLWVCSFNGQRSFFKLPPFTKLKEGIKETKGWYESKGWV